MSDENGTCITSLSVKGCWMDFRSLRDEYACARCCRAPEQQLSQTEVNHVSSLVTIQNFSIQGKKP
jgi:hypothetical protein